MGAFCVVGGEELLAASEGKGLVLKCEAMCLQEI